MKYQKKIDLPGWESVCRQVLSYAQQHTDFIDKGAFWNEMNPPEHTEIFNVVKDLFDSSNLNLVRMALLVMNQDFILPHQDSPAETCTWPVVRINLPILNCDDTKTVFYTANKWEPVTITEPTVYSYHKLENLKIADSVEITKPTALRTQEIHNVISFNKNKPRITLTCYFDPDPIYLLKD